MFGYATVTAAFLDRTLASVGGTGTAHAQTGAASDFQANAHTLGDALTLTDGAGHSSTFYSVAAGTANAANGTFSDGASLVSAVNSSPSSVRGLITASTNGAGDLQLDSPSSMLSPSRANRVHRGRRDHRDPPGYHQAFSGCAGRR